MRSLKTYLGRPGVQWGEVLDREQFVINLSEWRGESQPTFYTPYHSWQHTIMSHSMYSNGKY